jgi:hypothetical protein
MDMTDDEDIRQTLDNIQQLLERIAAATEELASCIYSTYHGPGLRVTDLPYRS